MLDGAACGLPIIVNHTMSAPERVEGNGFTYKLNHRQDLVATLLKLGEASVRGRMGAVGAEKMRSQFSWKAIASRRLHDYQMSLQVPKGSYAPQTSAADIGLVAQRSPKSE